MKLDTIQRDVQSVGIMRTARATIKATPKLFSMFENDTYANKPLAIARELVANGIDAHKAAGTPQRAVEVTLPIELDPVFSVKDFGIGMSHLFMMGDPDAGIDSQFMSYTDGSTKDKDDDAIGGFGIGSKAPLSMVDQYNIVSCQDGMRGVYSVFKGEDGVPAIGCLGYGPTTEPNGVEVSFPVEIDQIATFHEAAQQALQYFRPLPVVNNGTVVAPKFAYEGVDWAIRDKAGPLGIIMGGIRYPVTTTNLDYTLKYDTKLMPLLEYGIDLWLPIGACGIAMSREQLSYVPKTSTSIEAALRGAVDDVVATFSTMFDSYATRWAAAEALGRECGVDNSYGHNARQQLVRANAKYLGEDLTSDIATRATPGSAWVIMKDGIRGNLKSLKTVQWRQLAELFTLTPGLIGTVFLDDMPEGPKSKMGRKVREYLEENGRAKETVVLRVNQWRRQTEQQLLDALGNPEVVRTSSLPEPAAIKRGGGVKSQRPRVRMFTYDGSAHAAHVENKDNLREAAGKRGISEVRYADQPTGGVLVVMENFELPGNLRSRIASGLIDWDELHFVNRGDADKLSSSWVRFDAEFADRLDTAVSAYPQLAERLAVLRNNDLSWLWSTCRILGSVNLSPAAQRRPFGRILDLYRRYVSPLNADQHKLAPFITPSLPRGVDPAKLDAGFRGAQRDAVMLLDALNLNVDEHLQFFVKQL